MISTFGVSLKGGDYPSIPIREWLQGEDIPDQWHRSKQPRLDSG